MDKVKKLVNVTDKDKLKQFREITGLTQAELAKSIGMDQPYIQRYETGKYRITNELIRKLNQYHQLSYRWWFNNEGKPIEPKEDKSKSNLIKDVSVLNNNLVFVMAKLEKLEESFVNLYSDYHELKHKVQYRD